MLDTLRISANTYKEILETETRYKTPGHVEVLVECIAIDDETGEEEWFRIARSEGTPEQARALAERWEQTAAELRRVAKEAERLKDKCRIVADPDMVGEMASW